MQMHVYSFKLVKELISYHYKLTLARELPFPLSFSGHSLPVNLGLMVIFLESLPLPFLVGLFAESDADVNMRRHREPK